MEDTNKLDKNDYLALIDEQENMIGVLNSVENMPIHSDKISKEGVLQLKNILGEVIKDVALIPNKTYEIYLNSELSKMVKDGVAQLQTTKNGEVLAHVIDSKSKKVLGIARVKNNVSKQITSAGFQILSFMVAQSHLDDINASLKNIESLCKKIRKDHEDEIIGKLDGLIKYLLTIIEKIRNFSPNIISKNQKNQIENCIKEFYQYQGIFIRKISSLVKSIKNLEDLDTFGTENTYNKILELQSEYDNIMSSIELLNKFYILLKMIVSYLDVYNKDFSLIQIDDFFKDIEKKHTEYISVIDDKVETLLKSKFNADETLQLRKEKIILGLNIQNYTYNGMCNYRLEVLKRLDDHLAKFKSSNGIKYAIKLDKNGEVEEACLV
ncbi:Hypothetical protein GGC_0820 [Haemophilus haemolyticus M21621]|jgi:hypothetical protein boklC_34470|nr:Hypothetical protein GGC_0820 [Haemophilus haemolyticus M21621]